jgi:hypothetical protein
LRRFWLGLRRLRLRLRGFRLGLRWFRLGLRSLHNENVNGDKVCDVAVPLHFTHKSESSQTNALS